MSQGAVFIIFGLSCLVLAAFSQENVRGGMQETAKMIPQGFVNHQVVIPSFKDGRLSSRIKADTVVRLDEKLLEAKTARVEIFSEVPAQNVLIEMPSAIFQMEDGVLRSGERSRITRADFEVEGDTLVFDTHSSLGAMRGRVRTLIFDTGAPEDESKKEKKRPD